MNSFILERKRRCKLQFPDLLTLVLLQFRYEFLLEVIKAVSTIYDIAPLCESNIYRVHIHP